MLILLGASAFLAMALVVLFSGTQRKKTTPPAAVTASAVTASAVTASAVTATRTPEAPAEPAPRADGAHKLLQPPPLSQTAVSGGTNSDLYRQLNDTAIGLIQKNQHWQGIYYLEQARKQQPERVEALINMAVALAELGLRGPAKRIFSEAHALAPNHPLLRQNLELLGQADFFDPQWLAALTAGHSQPGQTTQPK